MYYEQIEVYEEGCDLMCMMCCLYFRRFCLNCYRINLKARIFFLKKKLSSKLLGMAKITKMFLVCVTTLDLLFKLFYILTCILFQISLKNFMFITQYTIKL